MRFLAVALVVGCCVSPLHSAEAKVHSPPPHFSGHDYLSLQEWAEANRFSIHRGEDELRLTNSSAHLAFKLNSQKAEINGVNVFLAYPIVWHQSAPFIADKDIERSLTPVLAPAKCASKPCSVKVIALSAGHGGKDCGYRVGAREEKNYTLLLTKELQKLVTKAGLKAVLIRSSDRAVELEDRPELAKRAKADVFVELHYNSAGAINAEPHGVEVYCLTPAGAISTNGGTDQYPVLPGNHNDSRNMLLAYQLQKSLVQSAGLADRGVRRARFVVLREAEMPAVLIEAGFMSQPEEMRRIEDPVHRRQTAQAILDGLLAYKRLLER